MRKQSGQNVCFAALGTNDLPQPVRVPEVTQRRDGSGTGVEVIGAVGYLTGTATKALRKLGLRALDLTAAINGACW